MRTEQRKILIECLTRQNAIAASPEPPAWKWWEVNEWRDCVAYGPRYLPAEWFGGMTDAQRQRCMRAVYDLDAQRLLDAMKTEGNRLQRIRLTDEGKRVAAEIAAQATEGATDAAPDWSTVPLVEQEPPPPRAACPHCGSRAVPRYHDSFDQGDGSRLRHCTCRDCEQPFRVLIEFNPSELDSDFC